MTLKPFYIMCDDVFVAVNAECVCVTMSLLVHQLNSQSVMPFSPGSIMMAGGDGLHGDEAGRKRELRLLKNKLVIVHLCSVVCRS